VTIVGEVVGAKKGGTAIETETVIGHDGGREMKDGLADANEVRVGVGTGLVVAFPVIDAVKTYLLVEKGITIAVIGVGG
jgi:hypothetical protein